METYTKINTLYKRYLHLNVKDCPNIPNEAWRCMANTIILDEFSDPEIGYLRDCLFDGYSKIDGTNSKIIFYPSTGEVKVGGKTDNACSQHGQFAFLLDIAYKIKGALQEIFPPTAAKFIPKSDDNGRIIYNTGGAPATSIEAKQYEVTMEEVPIYIFGEYFGAGIQKGAGYSVDGKTNRFAVFDIEQQGWWVPNDVREDILNRIEHISGINLERAPYVGQDTIKGFEYKVMHGFHTLIENASNPDIIEEGIVARPIVPIKSSRGRRIIVKIKYHDYNDYNVAVNKIGREELYKFNRWYLKEWEPKFAETFNVDN